MRQHTERAVFVGDNCGSATAAIDKADLAKVVVLPEHFAHLSAIFIVSDPDLSFALRHHVEATAIRDILLDDDLIRLKQFGLAP